MRRKKKEGPAWIHHLEVQIKNEWSILEIK
jgi:hypothetical protein